MSLYVFIGDSACTLSVLPLIESLDSSEKAVRSRLDYGSEFISKAL
jgi:hypothetical protein